MSRLRALLHRNRLLAGVLLALALWLRAMVPAGYMPGGEGRELSVRLCEDGVAAATSLIVAIHDRSAPGAPRDTADAPCAYAVLAMGAVSAAAPALLAAALAFALLLGFHSTPIRMPAAAARLRPPLRGPPARVRPIA